MVHPISRDQLFPGEGPTCLLCAAGHRALNCGRSPHSSPWCHGTTFLRLTRLVLSSVPSFHNASRSPAQLLSHALARALARVHLLIICMPLYRMTHAPRNSGRAPRVTRLNQVSQPMARCYGGGCAADLSRSVIQANHLGSATPHRTPLGADIPPHTTPRPHTSLLPFLSSWHRTRTQMHGHGKGAAQ